jgi:hypothetical protein
MDIDDSNNNIDSDEIYSIKQILNRNQFDSFFMHSLYDQYVKEGDGNTPFYVAKKFKYYLQQYLEELKIPIHKYNIIYDILSAKIANYVNLVDNYIERSAVNSSNNYIEKNNDILLLSGFNILSHGHSIVMYFKNNSSDSWDLFIVNSGLGITSQSNAIKYTNSENNELIKPIIVKIPNINTDIVKNICNFHKQIKITIDITEDENEAEEQIVSVEKEQIVSVEKEKEKEQTVSVKKEKEKEQTVSVKKEKEKEQTVSVEKEKEKEKEKEQTVSVEKENKKRILLYQKMAINRYANSKLDVFPIESYHYEQLFYSTIIDYTEEYTWELYKEDNMQLSGSCTYFALYYFIKYFIFIDLDHTGENDDIEIFNNFVEFIHNKEIIKFLKLNTRDYKLNISNYNFDHKQHVVNAYDIILKKYEFENKHLYVSAHNKFYSNIKNTINPIKFYRLLEKNNPKDIIEIYNTFIAEFEGEKSFDTLYNFFYRVNQLFNIITPKNIPTITPIPSLSKHHSSDKTLPNLFTTIIIQILVTKIINIFETNEILKIDTKQIFVSAQEKLYFIRTVMEEIMNNHLKNIYFNLMVKLINIFIKLIDTTIIADIVSTNSNKYSKDLSYLFNIRLYWIDNCLPFPDTNYRDLINNILSQLTTSPKINRIMNVIHVFFNVVVMITGIE